MRVSELCLYACVIVCIVQISLGAGHVPDLVFTCREGWILYEGECYMAVNISMTRAHAVETCRRQGGELFMFKNQQQFYSLKNDLPDSFWTGAMRNWELDSNDEILQSISIWANNEPIKTNGGCISVDKEKGAFIQDCQMMNNFVCQYDACLQGFVPCALGSKCIKDSRDVCNNIDNCVDKSDERNCPAKCKNYMMLTESSGEFSTQRINDGTDCWWALEAPIGKWIRVDIPAMTLEKNCAFLQIWTGSPSVAMSNDVKRLTGTLGAQSFYSSNNFLHLRLFAEDVTFSTSPQTIKWTTDHESDTLPAVASKQSSVCGGKAIHLLGYFQAVSETAMDRADTPIYVKDGEMGSWQAIETFNYYTTATNNLWVMMENSNTIRDYSLSYISGCNITLSSLKGRISSPGSSLMSIPHEIVCKWTLLAGENQDPDQGMSISFPSIILSTDPRQSRTGDDRESKDTLLVFVDGNTAAEDTPVPFDNNVENIIHASGGRIELQLITDVALNSKLFIADFGKDCEPLQLSAHTIQSTEKSFYGESVMLSCPEGYQFNLDQYKDKQTATVTCKSAGFVINDSLIIPECQIVRCGTPRTINNGFIQNSTNTSYGGQAWYTCSQGFAPKGDQMVTCNEDGKWSQPPICTSAQCSVMNNELVVSNGGYRVEAGNNITTNYSEYNIIVEFYCNPGYELIGQKLTHCGVYGWSHKSTPTCQKKRCLIPQVTYAEEITLRTIEFDSSLQINCLTGFRGSGNVKCLENQTLDQEITCTDIDECTDGNNCESTTTCVNTNGSYICECLQGYQRGSSKYACTECATDNEGCSDTCADRSGNYECTCGTGFELFTEDGRHGFKIPESETGFLAGDLYRLNHTCVRKSCPSLSNIADGTYLRALKTFHYEDKVTLQCDDGYHITGLSQFITSQEIECLSGGSWSNSFSCSARSCSIPSAPKYGSFDRTSVAFKESVKLYCIYTTATQMTQTAHCIYDNGTMRLGGEEINKCPVIDCGQVMLPDGGAFDGSSPLSTEFLDARSNFIFNCDTGYDISGDSNNTNEPHRVTCKVNGRWEFGTLRCLGKKCTDPRTPADAIQIAESYEQGKMLRYECVKPGFKPLLLGEDRNYTCEYNQNTDSANWSNNLTPDNLPVCTDVTSPVVTFKTEDRSYFPMQTVEVVSPTFSDNFGINTESKTNYMATGDVILNQEEFSYSVTDFMDNSVTHSFTYNILAREDKPNLSCPLDKTILVNSTDDGIQQVKDFLVTYDESATLVVTPSTIQVTIDKIGTARKVSVTLVDTFGRKSECTFLIHYTARRCFEQALYPDANAQRSCKETSNGLSCNSTCNDNFIYKDGSKTKTFQCNTPNNWNFPQDLDIFCLSTENPAYLADVDLIYAVVAYPASLCSSPFSNTIASQLNIFKEKIGVICNGMNWGISVEKEPEAFSLVQISVTLRMNLDNTDKTTEERQACVNQIQDLDLDVFNITNDIIDCSGVTKPIYIQSLSIGNPVISCITTSYHLLEDTDVGNVCGTENPAYLADVDLIYAVVAYPASLCSSPFSNTIASQLNIFKEKIGVICNGMNWGISVEKEPEAFSLVQISITLRMNLDNTDKTTEERQACVNQIQDLDLDVFNITNDIIDCSGVTRPIYVQSLSIGNPVISCITTSYHLLEDTDVGNVCGTENPAYLADVDLIYTVVAYPASFCSSPFSNTIASQLNIFKEKIGVICNGMNWGISVEKEPEAFSLAQISITLRMNLDNTDKTTEERQACVNQIQDLDLDVFNITNDIIDCSGVSRPIYVQSLSIGNPVISCITTSYHLLEDTDVGNVCGTENPAYLADVDLIYTVVAYPASFCSSPFSNTIASQLNIFKEKIGVICNGMNWGISVEKEPEAFSLAQISITLRMNLDNTDKTTEERQACVNQIQDLDLDVFNITNDIIDCSGVTRPIYVQSLSIGNPVISCITTSYHLLEDTDVGNVCVPCGPGFYFDNTTNSCVKCLANQYQNLTDQTECIDCPSATAPDPRKIDCDNTCPPGFTSSDGFYPCNPCPVDEYWMDSKTCASCPSPKKTAGLIGTDNEGGCYDECPVGHYSETGLNIDGCRPCPLGFYQQGTSSTQCSECSAAQTTNGTGKTSPVDCNDLESCSSFGCDPVGTNTCIYQFHRAVCVCKAGYGREKCGQKHEICDANPCTTGSTCLPISGGTNTDFTCTCRTDLDRCEMQPNDTNVESENPNAEYRLLTSVSKDSCKQTCLDEEQCQTAIYVDAYGGCYLYNDIVSTKPQTSGLSSDLMNKICTKAFSGDRCETDSIDDCATAGCAVGSMCMNKINGFKCLCPEDSGFEGELCSQVVDVCNPDPCVNGECTAYGTVRYLCTCNEGYTGENCDTMIDECTSNPNVCLGRGSCNDPERGYHDYQCACANGFYGKNCEQAPDFCAQNDCLNNVCWSRIFDMKGMCACEGLFQNDGPFACKKTSQSCDDFNCDNGDCSATGDGLSAICTCSPGWSWTGLSCQHNIDVCTKTPCLNGATCSDLVNSFNCSCADGFEGENCEIDINECTDGICKNGTCKDGAYSYTCNCLTGYTGNNCETDIDECASLPCQRGGECKDGQGAYTCTCASGWTGTNCEASVNNCGNNPCLNDGTCYSILNNSVCRCQSGTEGQFCDKPSNLCDVLSEADLCQNNGECLNTEGTAICMCETDYSGDSCQFIKDWCSQDTCKNGGTCSAASPHGYQCECQEGYSGVNCEIAADPCRTSPCGNSGASCKSTVTEYICQCPEGRVFTGLSCKAPDTDYSLLVNTMNGEETSCLSTPFHINSAEISVLLRIKVYAKTKNPVLFNLFGGPELMPAKSTSNLAFQVLDTGITIRSGNNTEIALPYDNIFGNSLFDGNWHVIGIAMNRLHGNVSSTIDVTRETSTIDIGQSSQFNDNVQICLGTGVLAEYSNISIFDYSLTHGNFISAFAKTFTPSQTPVQNFWNYNVKPSTKILKSALQVSPLPGATDISPTLDCNGITETVEFVLDSRFISLNGLINITGNLAQIKDKNAPGLTLKHSLPDELLWGYYEGIVVGMDENGNYGQCRFPVYIKYNEQCLLPVKQDNYVQNQPCDSGDGVCSVSCNVNNAVAAAQLPRYMPCSKLGVFDTQAPKNDLILPACNAAASPKYVVSASMQFQFDINCQNVPDAGDTSKLVLTENIEDLKDKWSDVCNDDCSNIQFVTTTCDTDRPKRFNVMMEVQLETPFLTYAGGSEINAEDALRIIIKLDEALSLNRLANGILVKDTVQISQSEVCTTSGYAMIRSGTKTYCVPCGPGRYYMGTEIENDCVLCPRGMYQNELGQMECKPCGNSTNGNPRTTYQMGAIQENQCVEVCSAGQFFKEDENKCVNCDRHYYQDEEGQNYCKPCSVGYKTIKDGSTRADDCKEDCPAGKYRDADTQQCLNCSQGSWRSLEYDDCTPCDNGRRTKIDEFGTSALSCNMDDCPAGKYWSEVNETCLGCDLGYFQSDRAMLMCEKCPKNYTTPTSMSIHVNNCTFYCAMGYEEDTDKEDTCKPCQRGFYKDNMGQAKFEACKMCDGGNTTDIIGAVSVDNCSVQDCPAGKYRDADTQQCLNCSRGYWRSLEYDDCQPCDSGRTTKIDEFGTSALSCNMVKCPVGTYGEDGIFKQCGTDSYQNATGQTMCNACPENTYNDIVGSPSVDACKKRSSNMPVILGAAIGGGGALLILLLVVVAVYRYLLNKKKKKKKKNDPYDVLMFDRHVYDDLTITPC